MSSLLPKKEEHVLYDNITSAADSAVSEEMHKRLTDRLVAEKLAIIDSFGADNYAEGTVFSYVITKGEITAHFTIVKDYDGKWKESTGYRYIWEELVAKLVSGSKPVKELVLMVPATK
jgi:hypothetical protein